MRRLTLPALVFIAVVMLASAAGAERPLVDQDGDPLVVLSPPQNWIDQEIRVDELEPVIQLEDAGPASDQCATATALNLSTSNTADGSGTTTNVFSQDPADPEFSCMFGTPVRRQGFRTAWYKLVAGSTGVVTVTTEGTNYDTVLGLYIGNCQTLVALGCSDDFQSFQSSLTFPVVRGRTYFIEVADYKPGAPTVALLQLSAVMHPTGARWTQVGNMPFGGVSRHAFVFDGYDMYVIGGQMNIVGTPNISNKLLRYNAITNQWAELADVPGSSVANTTAVRLGKKIFVPGGFNGNQNDYVNVHLMYDITTDFWKEIKVIPSGLLPNGKMFAWSSGAAGPGDLSYYLTGGLSSFPELDADAVVLNNVYKYMPGTDQWSAVTPMLTKRYAHTAAWIFAGNRGLCVAGGLTTGTDSEGDPATILLTDGECFNPATNVWQKTGPLNFPRYSAGSAVGFDGNWYIFGGLDATGGVPETEVYDPITNTWRPLGGDFNLGGTPTNPARAWPRGAFWGDSLFVFGGHTPPTEQRVISAVERMAMGPGFVPLANTVLLPFSGNQGSDNLLARSLPLALNVPVSGNFVHSNQFFNAYYFDWPAFGRATIRLTNVPNDTNFNIALYNSAKGIRAQGNTDLTGDKEISITLEPDRYWVVVERIFPKDLPDPADVYLLTLTGD